MHKISKQRDGILTLLAKKNYHPTPDEIYQFMRNEFPKISLGTVYRNLDQLAQMGKIVKIDVPDQPARYDGNTREHHHIRCINCSHIEDVWINFNLLDFIDANTEIPNFEVLDYDISILGICKKCKQ